MLVTWQTYGSSLQEHLQVPIGGSGSQAAAIALRLGVAGWPYDHACQDLPFADSGTVR